MGQCVCKNKYLFKKKFIPFKCDQKIHWTISEHVQVMAHTILSIFSKRTGFNSFKKCFSMTLKDSRPWPSLPIACFLSDIKSFWLNKLCVWHPWLHWKLIILWLFSFEIYLVIGTIMQKDSLLKNSDSNMLFCKLKNSLNIKLQ